MSGDYALGQRDSLRLALAILAAEEAKWAGLLGGSRSGRRNSNRAVRHKAQVAQKRSGTALGRITPRPAEVGVPYAADEWMSGVGKAD